MPSSVMKLPVAAIQSGTLDVATAEKRSGIDGVKPRIQIAPYDEKADSPTTEERQRSEVEERPFSPATGARKVEHDHKPDESDNLESARLALESPLAGALAVAPLQRTDTPPPPQVFSSPQKRKVTDVDLLDAEEGGTEPEITVAGRREALSEPDLASVTAQQNTAAANEKAPAPGSGTGKDAGKTIAGEALAETATESAAMDVSSSRSTAYAESSGGTSNRAGGHLSMSQAAVGMSTDGVPSKGNGVANTADALATTIDGLASGGDGRATPSDGLANGGDITGATWGAVAGAKTEADIWEQAAAKTEVHGSRS
jgi:hypothetical protein